MKKIVLLAAVMCGMLPVAKAEETSNENDVKSFCVGEFENPGQAEIKMGAGSFWEKAPVNFYTKYSGLQIIYDAEYLKPLADDNGSITEIVFKMGDEGSMGYIEANLHLYIQNVENTEFVKKEDTEKYMWINFDTDSPGCEIDDYEGEFYYMEDQEFHYVLDRPLKYEGKNLLVTAWSEVTNGEEVNTLISYAMGVENRSTMMMASDVDSFLDIYNTGFYLYPMSPERYVPVAKFYYTPGSSSISSVGTEASDAAPVYFNLQGQRVSGELVPGIYIRNNGGKSEKIIIK